MDYIATVISNRSNGYIYLYWTDLPAFASNSRCIGSNQRINQWVTVHTVSRELISELLCIAVAGGFSSLSLSPLYFFRFLLCFFLSLLCLLSSLLSVFSLSSPLSHFFLFFFSAALPCIYRKTGEGERVGAATVGGPLHYLKRITTPGKWVNCGRLIAPKPGKKVGEKRKKKKKRFFSPVFCASRGRRRWCRFKTALFCVFIFLFFCGDPKMGYNT